jgi:cytochrome c556
MNCFLVLGLALLFGGRLAAAQEDVVVMREALMKASNKNLAALGKMAKGIQPYDQTAVDTALRQFDDAAGKLPALYPDRSKGAKSDDSRYMPSEKIWENRVDFESHIRSFSKSVSEYQGKIKNLEILKAAHSSLDEQCKACHETYRVRND